MNRAGARDAYYTASASASASARQLAFAAVGVVWVIKPQTPQLPRMLLTAGMFAVLALAFDLFQYVYGTIAWGRFHRRKEHERVGNDEEFTAPYRINWPTNTFFALKVIFVAVCYVFLFTYLATVLW